MAPVVRSLAALRGVDRITAMTLLSELGDVSRFDNPRQLMAYLGLVPSEHSSGTRRRRGAITLTGNGTARRALVESAWCYRFPARQTRHLQRKAAEASDEAKAIAWRAQRRLCDRYRHLVRCGKNTKQANVAVARELAGFVWDIVRVEMPRLRSAARRAHGGFGATLRTIRFYRTQEDPGSSSMVDESGRGADRCGEPSVTLARRRQSAAACCRRAATPVLGARPAPRRSEVRSAANPRISA